MGSVVIRERKGEEDVARLHFLNNTAALVACDLVKFMQAFSACRKSVMHE